MVEENTGQCSSSHFLLAVDAGDMHMHMWLSSWLYMDRTNMMMRSTHTENELDTCCNMQHRRVSQSGDVGRPYAYT
jgi:hypothetical protein